MKVHGRQAKRAIYRWPALIGLVTAIGLIAGLLGDGVADMIAWAGLIVPIAVAALRMRPPRRA